MASYEIAPDISDSEEDLVATSSRGLLPTHTVPASSSSSSNKGKGRATSPANYNNTDERNANQGLEGRIGSGTNGQVGERSQRTTTFGGIKTETR